MTTGGSPFCPSRDSSSSHEGTAAHWVDGRDDYNVKTTRTRRALQCGNMHKIREVCCSTAAAHVYNNYGTCTAYSAVRKSTPLLVHGEAHLSVAMYCLDPSPSSPIVYPFNWHSIWQCSSSMAYYIQTIQQSNCCFIVPISALLRASQNAISAAVGTFHNNTGVLNSAGLLGWHIPALLGPLYVPLTLLYLTSWLLLWGEDNLHCCC